MSENLSLNAQAILLLTAPLIVGRSSGTAEPLTPGEYRRLALHLREINGHPDDLLKPDSDQLIRDCGKVVDESRLQQLLERGFLLSQAVERWHARAIWIVSRADNEYPVKLKTRLKENAPAVLYGCGERSILDTGGLAVVGSRNADDDLIEFAREIGSLAANAQRTVVSGGARGIDQAAMRGALEAGGRVIGVLADSLEKTVMNRENREFLLDGQLVLVSPYDPNSGFNVGNAMQRNKLIYAFGDAALVVSSDFKKGGTWAGATEQLEKLRLVPVYVRSTDETNNALDALRSKGALPWPNPKDAEGFDATLSSAASVGVASSPQEDLPLVGHEQAAMPEAVREMPMKPLTPARDSAIPVAAPSFDAAEELFAKVRELVARMLDKPRTPADITSALGVTKRQSDEWVGRLVAEGVLQKLNKPVRYAVRQPSLFPED